MIRRTAKFLRWSILAFVVVNFFLAVLTNVSVTPTDSDDAVFRTVLGLEKPQIPMSYEQELHLIKSLQALVLKRAPGDIPIPEYADREPKDLLKAESGMCFDRSRTLDKILLWHGFETRHLYILFAKHPVTGLQLPFWQALVTRGTDSHAVTEVKTSRGWLVVDSNSLWISVAADDAPVDGSHIFAQANRFASMPEYWNQPYWAIRGLYSRRGQFYRPFLPYPQMNWFDFISWFVTG